jgi:hypothetical protein
MTKTDSRLAARLAAISSLGASVIHFAVIPAHWQEWTASGVFFAAIALGQLLWAIVASVRPAATVLAAGILINVGAAALWIVSRTAGSPVGPHAGQPEVVEAAGICALLLECYVVMGAGWVWYRGRRAAPISGFGNVLVLTGASMVIAAAASAGVASGLQHGDHGPASAEADHHRPAHRHDNGHHGHPAPVSGPIVESPDSPAAPVDVAPPAAPVVAPPSPAPDTSRETDGHHGHSH